MTAVHDAHFPHGEAMLRYFNGDRAAMLICHQDGRRDDVPAAFWFRDTVDPLEQCGLELCRGRVLDLGAGAGVHALALQRRGLDVVALDVAPQSAEIMRKRGVHHPVVGDLAEFDAGPFDTILCLCNGLDKVGRLDALPGFLARMRSLLAPGGQIIADSFDLRVGADAQTASEIRRKTQAGRYFGEIDLVFEFEGRRGASFSTLQVDPDTLVRYAARCGYSVEIIQRQGGHFLARMTDGAILHAEATRNTPEAPRAA